VDSEDLAKMYVTDTKVVTLSLGGQGKEKGGNKNETITENVHENNGDMKLTWVKFTDRPECL
jgi:hypothetical protein